MTSEMVDLKRRPSDPEDKEFYKDPQKEEYYPLMLWLDKVEMDKLDLAKKTLGDEFALLCNVRVQSVSMSESTYSSTRTMSLAITSAKAADAEKESSDEEKAGKMFPTMAKDK